MLAMRQKRPAFPPSIKSLEIPAPVGGLNALDPATALPESDCLALYNMVAAELGLRIRQGWSEWIAGGLTGASDTWVRTVMPFSGSHKNGSTDKLFAVTSQGIWDVTAHGASTVAWGASTAYVAGSKSNPSSFVTNGGKTYVCVQSGTSAGSGGPTGTGTNIVDGACQWNYVASNTPPSLLVTFGIQTGDAGYGTFVVMTNGAGNRFLLYCDEENGYFVYPESGPWSQVTQGSGGNQINGVNPANFAAVCVWKSKVWFVQKDTSLAWYLPTNSIYGTATAFDFGGKMRQGGPLVNLYNWSYDAGQGMDTLLVGISTAGDVVIYQGTDPNSIATFGLFGSWSVGGVPYGRKIATDTGGELLIVSLKGLVQASKLVVGAPATVGEGRLYDSDKISPLFNLDAQLYYSGKGWAIGENPGDNTLMCLVPANGNGAAAKPYAMSLSNRSWSIYRDQPIISMGVWNGVMYFGTPDGRVARVGGYVDGVLFGNPNSFSPITWSLITGFTDLRRPTQKMLRSIVPYLDAGESNAPINAVARFNLDITEAPVPAVSASGNPNTWDNALWDQATWSGGGYFGTSPVIGASGMGRTMAVALCGLAKSRTSLVAIGVMYAEGGLL